MARESTTHPHASRADTASEENDLRNRQDNLVSLQFMESWYPAQQATAPTARRAAGCQRHELRCNHYSFACLQTSRKGPLHHIHIWRQKYFIYIAMAMVKSPRLLQSHDIGVFSPLADSFTTHPSIEIFSAPLRCYPGLPTARRNPHANVPD